MEIASPSLSPVQFKGMTHDELDERLASEFHTPNYAPTKKHPKSGWNVEAGIHRRVARPPEGQDEGPAVFNVRDYGNPDLPEYNSLKYMGGHHIGQEPIGHVYRGMSHEEWAEARQRGFIKSDQRGTIANWEGTNADIEPQTAVSYLPRGQRGHVAKIRVQPEDKWFTRREDQYIRTREPIPLSRVEHVVDLAKDSRGRIQFG